MALNLQFSVALRDGLMNAYETTIGTAAVIKVFTGTQPANCAAANSGTELLSITLPSDWMGASSSGTVSKVGTWSGTAIATGTAGHYRLYASNGTTCHEQGTCGMGGSFDMVLDNTSIATSQTVTVSTSTRTAGNP